MTLDFYILNTARENFTQQLFEHINKAITNQHPENENLTGQPNPDQDHATTHTTPSVESPLEVAPLSLCVTGPYQSVRVTDLLHLSSRQTVTLLAGGIGVTPCWAFLEYYLWKLEHFVAMVEAGASVNLSEEIGIPRVTFIWISRHPSSFHAWNLTLLNRLKRHSNSPSSIFQCRFFCTGDPTGFDHYKMGQLGRGMSSQIFAPSHSPPHSEPVNLDLDIKPLQHDTGAEVSCLRIHEQDGVETHMFRRSSVHTTIFTDEQKTANLVSTATTEEPISRDTSESICPFPIIYNTRPALKDLFKEASDSASKLLGSTSAHNRNYVFACGKPAMLDEAKQICRELGVHFIQEKFSN